MKRGIILLLCLVLACAMPLAAFGEATDDWIELSKQAEPVELPLADGSVTLSVYAGLPSGARQAGMATMAEHTAIQELVRRTGVNLEFYHSPENDDGTYFNTLVASGDWPDIFRSNFDSYPGQIVGAIEDGIIIDYTDLVYKYAPNFLYTIGSRGEQARKNVISDDGMIIRVLCEINDVGIPGEDYPGLEGMQHTGLIVRKDWLDELNLEVPRTIDEVTNMLIAFRDQKGAEVPYAMGKLLTEWIYDNGNNFASAFGVSIRGYQVEDGKVFYGRATPEYKEFIKLLANWYSEGLIDSDFISRTLEDARKMFINGRSGMVTVGNWEVREVQQLGEMEDPNFDIIAIQTPRLTDPDAEIDLSWPYTSGNGGVTMHISSTCEDQVLAMKWIDNLYTQDTLELMTWGVGELPDGNVTYFINDKGQHQFSDFINNNPLQPFNTFRFVYTYQDFQSSYDIDMQKNQYNSPRNIQAWEAWSYNVTNTGRLPDGITRTADEATEFSEIENRVKTYSDEMILKFIFGEEDLEAGFDGFVQQMYDLGLQKAIDINQAAYDRYNNR